MNWKNQIEKLGENFKAEKKNSILKLANKRDEKYRSNIERK